MLVHIKYVLNISEELLKGYFFYFSQKDINCLPAATNVCLQQVYV